VFVNYHYYFQFIKQSKDLMHRIIVCSFYIALCMPLATAFAQWSDDSTLCTTVCNSSGDQGFPQITTDGAGGAIMVWQDGRNSSTKIYAQRIDSSGYQPATPYVMNRDIRVIPNSYRIIMAMRLSRGWTTVPILPIMCMHKELTRMVKYSG
jgi:hypothetical protein